MHVTGFDMDCSSSFFSSLCASFELSFLSSDGKPFQQMHTTLAFHIYSSLSKEKRAALVRMRKEEGEQEGPKTVKTKKSVVVDLTTHYGWLDSQGNNPFHLVLMREDARGNNNLYQFLCVLFLCSLNRRHFCLPKKEDPKTNKLLTFWMPCSARRAVATGRRMQVLRQ
jgi:hypothetical protein